MPRSDIPCAAALLEKFFDHPQRNTKPQSDLLTVAILAVIRSQDSFPQIQRESSHGSNDIKASPIWLQFYLKCSSLPRNTLNTGPAKSTFHRARKKKPTVNCWNGGAF